MPMTCEKLGGDFQGVGSHCQNTSCGKPSHGACCIVDVGCLMLVEEHCFSEGGDWQGPNTSCDFAPCEPANLPAACCINGGCLMLPEDLCESVQGDYLVDAYCEIAECPTFCSEDVNGDGEVNVSDILAIIAAWGMCP